MGWTFYNASGQQLRATADKTATQAEMEAGSALTSFVTPGRTQFHPGVVKVWCVVSSTGSLETPDYGVSTVTDTGTGDHTVNFTTSFSGTVFSVVGGSEARHHRHVTRATGSIRHLMTGDDGSAADEVSYTAIFGDQ